MTKTWPKRSTKTREYILFCCKVVGQKQQPRPDSPISYGQEWTRKSYQYDLLYTIYYGQDCTRKSLQDPGLRFVTAKTGPERTFKTGDNDLLRPRQATKIGNTIYYGLEWDRRSHPDSGVRLLWLRVPRPCSTICYNQEWARKTERPILDQKESPRLGCTI